MPSRRLNAHEALEEAAKAAMVAKAEAAVRVSTIGRKEWREAQLAILAAGHRAQVASLAFAANVSDELTRQVEEWRVYVRLLAELPPYDDFLSDSRPQTFAEDALTAVLRRPESRPSLATTLGDIQSSRASFEAAWKAQVELNSARKAELCAANSASSASTRPTSKVRASGPASSLLSYATGVWGDESIDNRVGAERHSALVACPSTAIHIDGSVDVESADADESVDIDESVDVGESVDIEEEDVLLSESSPSLFTPEWPLPPAPRDDSFGQSVSSDELVAAKKALTPLSGRLSEGMVVRERKNSIIISGVGDSKPVIFNNAAKLKVQPLNTDGEVVESVPFPDFIIKAARPTDSWLADAMEPAAAPTATKTRLPLVKIASPAFDFITTEKRPPPSRMVPDWAKDPMNDAVLEAAGINPFSIFGVGCALPRFHEIFSTPDFRRCFQFQNAKNGAFECDLNNENGRRFLFEIWSRDIQRCAFPSGSQLEDDQVREYLRATDRHVDVSQLVYGSCVHRHD